MNPQERTLQFLKDKFINYYSTSKLTYPERFTRREWGFMFVGESFMQRHLAFGKTSELIKFLKGKSTTGSSAQGGYQKKNIPAHVYYSSAYYKDPNLQPMHAKVEGWLGADLIFDLDDDHLRNVEGLTYDQRLKKVKEIVQKKLLEDYILGDFGVDPKHIKLAFSGSRGYHIHINDPNFLQLTSAQRREIVDYLTSIGLNMDRIFHDEAFETRSYGKRKVSITRYKTPGLDAPGWQGRMARGVLELIKNLGQVPDEKAIELLKSLCQNLNQLSTYQRKKIKDEEVERLYYELFSKHRERINESNFQKYNVLELFSKDRLRGIFVNIVREHQKIEMAGETDEPVTTDVKRLIRLPSSIHGKTGFKAVPLTIDQLKDFEPLNDAIIFGSNPLEVQVKVEGEFKFRLLKEDFTVTSGIQELPEFAAIYLLCQRKAVIPNSA
jgi:DNA primase small subunit